MKYFITFLLLFSFHIIKAQIGQAENNLKEDELIYYYDKNWKGTSKEKAKFYKIITVNAYGEIIGEIYDYDKKGNLLSLYESALTVYKSDDNESRFTDISGGVKPVPLTDTYVSPDGSLLDIVSVPSWVSSVVGK